MIEFYDMLYGKLRLPDWIEPFLKLPEFVRLRDVRLSNIDSYQFKDFSRPTRWEHGIATAFLASRCAKRRNLSVKEEIQLILAALLHDVATPPYAHTLEHVVEGYNHEMETQKVLSAIPTSAFNPDVPVFESQLPQFWATCRHLERKLKTNIDVGEIAQMIVGEGDLGFLICGTVDLDNADNVMRACCFLGIEADRNLPLEIADWLALRGKIPTEIETIDEPCIKKWLQCRNELYRNFHECSSEEIGRQAFLEHIVRRAIDAGFSTRALVWSTDTSLLRGIEEIKDEGVGRGIPLPQLVQRYRLVEAPFELTRVSLDDKEEVRALGSPLATHWMENHLAGEDLEVLITVLKRRYSGNVKQDDGSLFPASRGYLCIFKLGHTLAWGQLPNWLKESIPSYLRGNKLLRAFQRQVYNAILLMAKSRPWTSLDTRRRERVITNLQGAGDWSFRLSKNESMHAYPSTFVHAIPSTLISSLGLAGDLIIDCFGGTGQTAVEAIKQGGSAITSDINAIANLVARSKLTFLKKSLRDALFSITDSDILTSNPDVVPLIPNIDRWFHQKTLEELLLISGFVKRYSQKICASILQTSFSAIITSCTGRRGEQHGYFADNTPLAKGESAPPYQNAIELFLWRLKRNILSLEKLYAVFEKKGLSPAEEVRRGRVLRLDARVASSKEYGIEPNSAGGIITSPPYLCMADYTLGQRLSYYWLFPNEFDQDFRLEIGSRRQRFSPKTAPQAYFSGLKQFILRAKTLLRPGGYLAMVMGSPVALAFTETPVLENVDQILDENGFRSLWSCVRPVQWHRNHGYSRLKHERISVHIME